MDKNYFSIESQQERIDYYKSMNKLEKHYKNELKTNKYDFKPIWLTDKSEIDFSVLGNDADAKLLFLDEYNIYLTSLDNLFNQMDELYRNSYKKESLWTEHDPYKITKVLKFCEDGNKMIPPILIMNDSNSKILPHDGKHRIALCHYFEISEIPVIISVSALPNFPCSFIERARKNNE